MGCGTSTETSSSVIKTTTEEKNATRTGSEGTTEQKATRNQTDLATRPRDYKVIVIGDSNVGKSSLLLQFTDRTFTERYMSTLGLEFKMRTVNVDGEDVKLQLWDTAGQERFKCLGLGYYRGADGVMIVYDITNQESFNNVKEWMDDIERYSNKNVPKVLIGNKSDLTTERTVDSETAKEYADGLGITFMETSAKDFINVDEAFHALAAVIV